MADVEKLAHDVRSSRLSGLKGFDASTDDIVHVWTYVSSFIENQMQKFKAVNISGLGMFNFASASHGEPDAKDSGKLRPVFILSEKFAQQHQLSCSKHHITGRIPVVDLNYAAIAFESPFTRDMVEQCVHEVVVELSRALASGKHIDFSFAGVGRLLIRNGKVKMKFLKDFVNRFDSSGKLEESMRNRPDTADSVMSRASTMRPATSNTLVLPGITEKKASRKPGMPIIDEDGELHTARHGADTEEEMKKFLEDLARNDAPRGVSTEPLEASHAPQDYYNESAMLEMTEPPAATEALADQAERSLTAPVTGRGTRVPAPYATAGAVSLSDVTMLNSSRLAPLKRSTPPLGDMSRPFTAIGSPKRDELPEALDGGYLAPVTVRSAPPFPRAGSPVESECGHHAGQELCYLCHQRDRRNVPVSFSEERKRREEQEDRLLHDYQIMKANEAVLKDQELEIARRHENQKVAAFNSGVAEAIQEKRHEKPPKGSPAQAYIFQRRPLTPHRSLKQNQLSDSLLQQVAAKENRAKASKAEQEFLERLEQVQLAEDLAAQREQYMREKLSERERYKAALETQLKYKPLPVPPRQPDAEIFGRNDTTEADVVERRQHARDIMADQLHAIDDRKRTGLLQKAQEQREEEERLNKDREEILEERSRRHDRNMQSRKALEDDWLAAAEAKRARELEDRLRAVASCSLVHEQCDRYRRCRQCKRKLGNHGESNVWRESRYIPGARVMV